MEYQSLDDVVNSPDAKTIVRINARKLLLSPGFRKCDLADIEQDLWVAIVKHFQKHDPNKASARTYLNIIVDTAVLMIARDSGREKRAGNKHLSSLDAPISNDEESMTLADTISKDDGQTRLGNFQRVDLDDLRMDIESILNRLPPAEQERIRQAAEFQIAEAARREGVSRQSLYRLLEKAKKMCIEAGYEDFQNSADSSNRNGINNR